MKKTRITIGTERAPYCEFNRPLPGLFWGALIDLLNDWKKFELGKKGTQFDKWLPKKN
jgi:hypothetical protein